jgi:hypothetical protein
MEKKNRNGERSLPIAGVRNIESLPKDGIEGADDYKFSININLAGLQRKLRWLTPDLRYRQRVVSSVFSILFRKYLTKNLPFLDHKVDRLFTVSLPFPYRFFTVVRPLTIN